MSTHEIKDILSQYINYLKENPFQYPVSGVDANSLYPSIIQCKNISAEYLVTDENYKNELIERGYPIHDINFEYKYENHKGEKCVTNVIAWTVGHDESNKEDTRFGLYPTILKNMFAQRAEMKKDLFKYKEIKERIEAERTNYENDNDYRECIFKLNYCDLKQKTLKLMMNSLYGELGNKKSPLFVLALAGAITSTGQRNLRLVKQFVETKHCEVYYGDTDSIYASCPKSYYEEVDKLYYTNQIDKKEYNTKLVEITFSVIRKIANEINEYLYGVNGNRYIKFAVEESGWPCAFLARKKYYFISHEGVVNFKPKDIFIRGLEVKKRGVSELLKIVCMDIMWKSMDINNLKTLRELVIDKIQYLFNKKWELKDFIQTGLWKAGEKKNVTLNSFVDRMREEGKPLPEVYERFNYVIIKRYPYKYDLRGRKTELKKADKMEYVDVVEENNYEIDLKYYFDKQLTGQFARLISYDKEFTEYTVDPETNDLIPNDDKTLNKCRKYILQLAKQYGNDYVDRGDIFKGVFKEVTKKYKQKAKKNSNNDKYKILFNSYVKVSEDVNLHQLINDNVESYIQQTYNFNNISNNIIKAMQKESLRLLYNSKNDSFYNQQIKDLNIQYMNKINAVIKLIVDNNLSNIIFNADNINIYNLVQHIRNKYNVDSICGSNDNISSVYDIIKEEELEQELNNTEIYNNVNNAIINQIYQEYINLISIQKNIKTNEYIYKSFYNSIVSTPGHMNKPHGFTGL